MRGFGWDRGLAATSEVRRSRRWGRHPPQGPAHTQTGSGYWWRSKAGGVSNSFLLRSSGNHCRWPSLSRFPAFLDLHRSRALVYIHEKENPSAVGLTSFTLPNSTSKQQISSRTAIDASRTAHLNSERGYRRGTSTSLVKMVRRPGASEPRARTTPTGPRPTACIRCQKQKVWTASRLPPRPHPAANPSILALTLGNSSGRRSAVG